MSAYKTRTRSNTSSFLCLPLVTKSNAHFIAELQRTSRHNKNACISLPPYLNGQPVDLKRLYNEVALRGGHKQVTGSHQWAALYTAMGFPAGCVESGHGLRSIYQRFLEPYERCQRMNYKIDELDSAHIDTDSQDSDFPSKNSKQTYSFNYADTVPNHLRAGWNLSTDLNDGFDYMVLENALRSDLPNEVDFALNSMLLMSSQSNGFSLHKNVRLLTLLLRSVGVSACDPYSFQSQSEHLLFKRFSNFWQANVMDEDGLAFLSPRVLDPHFEPCSVNSERHSDLLNLHDMAYGDAEGFRVQLVATVLRNLAVDGGLSSLEFGRDAQALRFIFLCIYANHSSLHQLGLETLSSLHFPVVGRLGPILKRLLRTLLLSTDRNDQIRGLQLVRRLCESPVHLPSSGRLRLPLSLQNLVNTKDRAVLTTDRNVEFLSTMPAAVFRCIISRLCLRDLHLVVLALDTLYVLSSLGSALCERMLWAHLDEDQQHEVSFSDLQHWGSISLLDMLISLLRLEAQSMGSESLIRVRVMQAVGTSTPNSKNNTLETRIQPSCALKEDFMRPYQPNSYARNNQNCVSDVLHVSQPPTSGVCSTNSLDLVPPLGQFEVSKTGITEPSFSVQAAVVTSTRTPLGKTVPDSVQVSCPTQHHQQQTFSPISSAISSTASTIVPRIAFVATPLQVSEARHTPFVQSRSTVTVNSTSNSILTISKPVSSEQILIFSEFKSLSQPPLIGPKSTPAVVTSLKPLNSSGNAVSTARSTLNRPLRASLDTPLPMSHATRRAFMLEWLRKNYTVHPHSTVPRIQIYNEYHQAHILRFGHNAGGAISAIEFHSELKSIFPGIEQIKLQTPGGNVEIHYHNLKHLHAPEPSSTQGMNDIMAAVLRPKSSTLPVQKTKTAQKRRRIGVTRDPINPSLPVPVDKDNGPPAKIVPRPIDNPVNGHSDGSEKGIRTISPINGMNKDVTRIITNSQTEKVTILPNGFQPKVCSTASTISQSSSTTTLSNCPKLNELVSRETNLVLLPVFTTVNFHPKVNNVKGQNLTVPSSSTTSKHMSMAVCFSPIQTKACMPAKHVTTATPVTMAVRMSSENNHLGGSDPSDRDPQITDAPNQQNGPDAAQGAQSSIFVCHWNSCGQVFSTSDHLIDHLRNSHCVDSTNEIACCWDGCTNRLLRASRDELIAHLADVHLSLPTDSANQNRKLSKPALTSISALLQSDSPSLDNSDSPIVIPSSPENSNSTEFPSQSNDAVATATESTICVKSVASPSPLDSSNPVVARSPETVLTCTPCLESQNNPIADEPAVEPLSVNQLQNALWSSPPSISPECRKALAGGAPHPSFTLIPQREGPVTKHIRLTAALTLKNFLQYSSAARRYVSASEDLVCELAFSPMESAPILFECLNYLNQLRGASSFSESYGFFAQTGESNCSDGYPSSS